MIFFFIFSFLLFLASIHYLMESGRAGVYPPKRVLRKRAGAFAGIGIIFFLFALLLYPFQ